MRCVTYLESHVYAYEGAHGAACLCKVKTKQLQIKDIKSELSLQLQQEIAPPFSRPIQQMFLDKPAGEDTPTIPGSSKRSQEGIRLQSHKNFHKRPKYNHKRGNHHNPIQGNGKSRQVHGRGGSGRIVGRGMSRRKANGYHDPQVHAMPMGK